MIDSVSRSVETAVDGISESLFEPVIRLGVTGLSRSGKTVFITSLVANLLERGRMAQFTPAANGVIEATFLQPQPDDAIPRFDYENHLSALTGSKPFWPDGTRAISQLRLSFRVRPQGIVSGLRGPRVVHLDIIDYPGEWLLDLPLMNQSFAEWSAEALALAADPARAEHSAGYLKLLDGTDTDAALDEKAAQSLAKEFTTYLKTCREAGLSACAPGRFLMPGDLEGSPALTFAPLSGTRGKRGSLYRAFERRFEAYKAKVVTPFVKDHFSRIDRQIVLVDVLGAIHAGPRAVGDLRAALGDVLRCFRVGQNGLLAPFLGKRVEKILFAATKADHLHHSQHGALSAIMQALLKAEVARVQFKGAETKAVSLASLRTTVEKTVEHDGEDLNLVQGVLEDSGKLAAMFAGDLPDDPNSLLGEVADAPQNWLDHEFSVMRFLPSANSLKDGSGPPHIRLDQAAEFLLGDKLR